MGCWLFGKATQEDVLVEEGEITIEFERDSFHDTPVEQDGGIVASVGNVVHDAWRFFTCGQFGRNKYDVKSILAAADEQGADSLLGNDPEADPESFNP